MHERQREECSKFDAVLEEASEQVSSSQRHEESGEEQRQAPSFDISSPSSRPGQWRTNRFAWLQRLSSFSPCLVLENSGSVARDHLAAERTFLAYVRTSLGCAATGVALIQFISLTYTSVPSRLQRFGKYLGLVIEVLGIVIMVIAVLRYFNMQKALIDGKFPPAGTVIWVIAFAMTAIILVSFGLMLGIALS